MRALNTAGVPRDETGWRRKRDKNGRPMKRDAVGPMTTQPISSDTDCRAKFDRWVAEHLESKETFDISDPAMTGKELVLPKAKIWKEAFGVFDHPDHSYQANPGNPLPAKVCSRRSLIGQKIVTWVPATVDEYRRRYGSTLFSFRACVFSICREVRAPVRTIAVAHTHTHPHTHCLSLPHTHARTHSTPWSQQRSNYQRANYSSCVSTYATTARASKRWRTWSLTLSSRLSHHWRRLRTTFPGSQPGSSVSKLIERSSGGEPCRR